MCTHTHIYTPTEVSRAPGLTLPGADRMAHCGVSNQNKTYATRLNPVTTASQPSEYHGLQGKKDSL